MILSENRPPLPDRAQWNGQIRTEWGGGRL